VRGGSQFGRRERAERWFHRDRQVVPGGEGK
jgi:hypothetical protein